MNEPITVGMVLWPLIGFGGLVILLGVIILILSFIGDSYKH
jgi:hypothetical protein